MMIDMNSIPRSEEQIAERPAQLALGSRGIVPIANMLV